MKMDKLLSPTLFLQDWIIQESVLCMPTSPNSTVLQYLPSTMMKLSAYELTRLEGIIPALESAHALGALDKLSFKPSDIVVLTVSGRGDKDIQTYLNNAPTDQK